MTFLSDFLHHRLARLVYFRIRKVSHYFRVILQTQRGAERV
jgi:hypothetical protein